MTLDVMYGNIPTEEAGRLGAAAITPVGVEVDGVVARHEPGTAEPWISRLIHSFIIATGARSVLETGSFVGGTSVWIVDALRALGGGDFTMCEIDNDRRELTAARLYNAFHGNESVHCHMAGDVLAFLRGTDRRFDIAWVDDCHEKPHVTKEIALLYPKMNPGGIILGHDVWGSCDLQEVFRKFGGYSLNLPRLGAAGGLGIIQVPPSSGDHIYLQSPSVRGLPEQLTVLGAIPL